MDVHYRRDLWRHRHLDDLLLRSGYDWYVSSSVLNRYALTCPATQGVDLADEDRKFLEYLHENGWSGEVGDEKDDLVDDESSTGPEKQ